MSEEDSSMNVDEEMEKDEDGINNYTLKPLDVVNQSSMI
jgi:hypothetical protein